jgi:hypothetical protein
LVKLPLVPPPPKPVEPLPLLVPQAAQNRSEISATSKNSLFMMWSQHPSRFSP